MALDPITYLWKDRKRILGLPITFTRYRLSEDRIFRETGLLNLKEEEVLLYRVRDLELKRSLFQRIFGVGTVCVHSSDKTTPHLDLLNIKNPREVKELLHRQVEEMKLSRRMRTTELLGSEEGQEGADPDGFMDEDDDSLE
ncbi:MAG: PH domain-containing protein [Pseudoflavonifractor capillosus]|uniref:PH domain-containing protein n=1 Tax=Pseudoflavonifractor capillosus TaxID=106588 RepID=UPI0023F6F168|nr:PH domain-containing protein [Pseudoflavonifractor capillosus]MCI5929255.1 PH domain-containing protein [Pseudoflavonifractor capillosus]MDY4660016.1 PH domain-containing protein [Pseudoflavonifractor capillosus]